MFYLDCKGIIKSIVSKILILGADGKYTIDDMGEVK